MPGNDANDAQRQSLLYAYPDDGQSEVAIPAPVVLRFSSDIELAAAENNIKLRLGGADGDVVPVTYSKVEADGRSILLTPTEKLQPLTDYTVTLRGVQLSVGKAPNRDIHFTTRALQRGPKSLVVADDDFTLTRAIPSGDVEEPVMDFSTFRFQFTQPIDPTSARYGLNPGDGTTPADTVALVDGSGELVEARLLTEGPYMTLDPTPEHLTPGETYTLTLGDGLASTFGNTFGGHEFTVTPQDSSPRGEPAILVQRITDSENRTRTSPLTGKPVNEVPVNATLLGQDNVTQASGDVRAELGDVTVYPDVTPVRIPADTILSGTSLDVLIGGEVPAGFESGEVKMHFLSDATGYLVPNPYDTHNRADALRIVRLFMDVAITTDEARANGGFTQDMLHIELIGVGEVDPREGVLKIDAVSVVEPDVLGQEFAHGMLSFQLESYKDQLNAPAPVPDTTPLEFQSWTLGVDGQTGLDKTAMAKPGDPIVLNFNRPLDRESIRGKVSLMLTDNNNAAVPQDIDYYVDGAALVIKPKEPLRYSPETNPTSYRLQLASGIKDLRGEDWSGSFDEGFELPVVVEVRDLLNDPTGEPTGNISDVEIRSPYILGVYPGFPCLLDESERDLENEVAGFCKGGIPPGISPMDSDDLLPIPHIPQNRPIIVSFSKKMDPNSIAIGRSFKVERIDTSGNTLEEVPGKVRLSPKTLIFTPSSPWLIGETYKYTLGSNDSISDTVAVCDGSSIDNSAICDALGLPLQTQLLGNITISPAPTDPSTLTPWNITTTAAPSSKGGGPDMIQYFIGAQSSTNILQVLSTTPSSDTNNNLVHDKNRTLGSEEEHAYFYWNFVEFYNYQNQEYGPTALPDLATQDLLDEGTAQPMDPDGVLPSPNSAKVLSLSYGINKISDYPIPFPGVATSGLHQIGGNVGCGFESYAPFQDQSGCNNQSCMYGIPSKCPKEKFTYLNSTIFAEVTDKYISDEGILVNIYPGHVLTTSFLTVLKGGAAGSTGLPVDSGYQVMRMRHTQEGNIQAYIKSGNSGQPTLEAEVDLYLNAPILEKKFKEILFFPFVYHNFYSYKVTMRLSGPIKFLDDGRMLIEQKNDNEVHFNLLGNSPITKVDLFIPAQGSFLQYLSQPIK
ncbi:Ig-like domain-containing protein [Alcanivorax xiamenensis]|nr:Ig-like domain-containing protein [Alcanivorax xiamenensis]